jgi:hypothetical protein
VRWGRVLIVVAMVLVSVRPAVAQQKVDYASLSGRVTDPQGAVVQGAKVSARQTDTNVTA